MIENSILISEEEYNQRKIKVICPICKLENEIHIPRNILKKIGLTTISIPKDSVCEHHFQMFIDKDFKVRGYQKVDFELEDDSIETYYNCQLCDATMRFDINDENSYLKREPHSTYLGKILTSYRVAHYFNDELHVNNILVDDEGIYNDHLNSNKIFMSERVGKEQKPFHFFRYMRGEQEPLYTHPLFNLLILFNTTNHWLFDLVCTPQFNSLELTNILYQKANEANSIYSALPDYLKITIADKVFHLWFSQSNVICANLMNELDIQWMNPVLKELVKNADIEEDLISKIPRILIVNDFFNVEYLTEDNYSLVRRLISDDMLHVNPQIKYNERLPRIVRKLNEVFVIESDLLMSFFKENKSVIEFLKEKGKKEALLKFVEMVDFINRRKLLG